MIKHTKKFIRQKAGNLRVQLRQRPKVYVIGANKTGTSSLERFLSDLGYRMGPQRQFEMLMDNYFDGDWEEIMKIIQNYEAFQDVPFSKSTDAFISNIRRLHPSAKFILSTRDDASEWYHSLIRFHRKMWYGNKEEIEWCDVQKVEYATGIERALLKYHNMDVLDPNYKKSPYDQEILESWYDAYNKRMMKLFMDDGNFIQINLKNQDSAVRIKTFLGKEDSEATILRLNTTK